MKYHLDRNLHWKAYSAKKIECQNKLIYHSSWLTCSMFVQKLYGIEAQHNKLWNSKEKYRNFCAKVFFPFKTVTKNKFSRNVEMRTLANGKYLNLNQFNGLMNKAADVLVKFSDKLCTFVYDIKLSLVVYELYSGELVFNSEIHNIIWGQRKCSSKYFMNK